MTIEKKIEEIINKIYDQEDENNLNKEFLPIEYKDSLGITTCFVLKDNSSSFTQLNKIAEKLNQEIKPIIEDEEHKDMCLQYVKHIPHITAASIIDPLKDKNSVPEGCENAVWDSLKNSLEAIVKVIDRFRLSFKRIHIGAGGTVSLIGYPDSESVGKYKELVYYLFKSERWWNYTIDNMGTFPDHSVSAVIGHIEDKSNSNAQFHFSYLRECLKSLDNLLDNDSNERIHIDKIYLVKYSNRLINPEKHIKKTSSISLR